MENLTDGEVAYLHRLLEDQGDRMYHHPNDYDADDHRGQTSLRKLVFSEAKRRRLWWAR